MDIIDGYIVNEFLQITAICNIQKKKASGLYSHSKTYKSSISSGIKKRNLDNIRVNITDQNNLFDWRGVEVKFRSLLERNLFMELTGTEGLVPIGKKEKEST